MLTPILVSLAITASAHSNDIIVVNDQPTVLLDVRQFDLRDAAALKRVKSKIRWAADRVCVRGYGIGFYPETVACVKAAIKQGDAQLGAMVAQNPSTAALTATIAVTAPTK